MMRRWLERGLWIGLGVGVVVALGWAALPASSLYTEILTPHVILAVACTLKLCFLATGAVGGALVARRFEADNPVRNAWWLLALGIGFTFLGQLCLAPFQIARGESPFPSIGDLFFVTAYPFFIAAMLSFLRAYQAAGFPVPPKRERLLIVAVVALLAGGAGFTILEPIVGAEMSALEKTLNIGYPALDFILLIPLALLLRTTLGLGMSPVGRVWLTFLSGFLAMCLGDIAYAYLAALGLTQIDPFMHVAFLTAYGLIGLGVLRQVRLLAD
jgi:hypothetical protein